MEKLLITTLLVRESEKGKRCPLKSCIMFARKGKVVPHPHQLPPTISGRRLLAVLFSVLMVMVYIVKVVILFSLQKKLNNHMATPLRVPTSHLQTMRFQFTSDRRGFSRHLIPCSSFGLGFPYEVMFPLCSLQLHIGEFASLIT